MIQDRRFGTSRGVQSPLVQDVRKQRNVARGPTSYAEAYWPFYIGIGGPGIFAGLVITVLMVGAAARPIVGLMMLFFGVPFISLSFLLISLITTRALSSIRGGAETIGNIGLGMRTNTGFKIGAAIGFGLFLLHASDSFVDPFTGERSFKTGVVAISLLKAIGLVGFFGTVLSRIEDFFQNRFQAKMSADKQEEAPRLAVTEAKPALKTPAGVRQILAQWPKRAAAAISMLAFFGQIIRGAGSLQIGNLLGALVFCLLAYFVLRFYFFVLNKVLRGLSGLYGFAIGVRKAAA